MAGEGERFKEFFESEPGPTGQFPDGRISPDDEGELNVRMGVDPQSRQVIIDFGMPTTWIGLPPEKAIEFGNKLIAMAKTLS